jgi:hypothetical protein
MEALDKPRNIQSKGSIGDIVTDTGEESRVLLPVDCPGISEAQQRHVQYASNDSNATVAGGKRIITQLQCFIHGSVSNALSSYICRMDLSISCALITG